MPNAQNEPVFIVKLTGILDKDAIEKYARKFSEVLPGRVVVVDNKVEDIYKMTRLDVERLAMQLTEVTDEHAG